MFEWKGDIAKQLAEQAGKKALLECAQDLKRRSQEEVPVKGGDLQGSCNVSDINGTGKEMTVTVGYNTDYDLRQHEHTEYNHPNGGKAKYLEDPFKAHEQRYQTYIANEIKKALGD